LLHEDYEALEAYMSAVLASRPRSLRGAHLCDLQLAARDAGRPWEWGKAFDHSAPCAPIVPAAEIGHPSKGRIWLSVNGTVKQDADISQLIWSVPEVIAFVSASMALAPGDLIFTGTPAGVGPLVAGDVVAGGIEGIGDIGIRIGPAQG
jgi:fumarylpyruvate hydrolase